MYPVARLPSGLIRILGQDENNQQVNVYLNPLDALDLGLTLQQVARQVLAHHTDEDAHPGWRVVECAQ